MRISLLSIVGCPNRQVAEARLAEALRQVGEPGRHVEHIRVATDEQAQAVRFRGSPTILIDGEDLFETGDEGPFRLTCRVYPTATGLAGSPTVDQLVAALLARGLLTSHPPSGVAG